MDCHFTNSFAAKQQILATSEPLTFFGTLGRNVVSVMIDSGASLNFKSASLVEQLGWPPMIGQPTCRVQTASGW